MIERKQPIVLGINEKGELIWSNIEMPLWQRKMFPIRYTGDFIAFWQKLKFFELTGFMNEDAISADFKSWVPSEYEKKHKRKHHKGD